HPPPRAGAGPGPRLLSERGVARERVRVRPHAVLTRTSAADRVGRAPFREARAEAAVFLEALTQPVQTFCYRLAVAESKRLGTPVDLDPRNDSLRFEQAG